MWKFPAIVMATALVGGCASGCETDVLATLEAPNGRLHAVLFQRSCGATTGYSTQVSIMRAGALPQAPGNAFVADTNNGAARAALGGGPWTDVAWVDNDHLIIRYDAQARVFARRAEVSGVGVSYQAVNR